MAFEIVVVDKKDAGEAETKNRIWVGEMVVDGILYNFTPLPGSSFNNVLHLVHAELVFSDWLDVLQEFAMGQTITLWRVAVNDDLTLFSHNYIGTIENERLPRACKIERKG